MSCYHPLRCWTLGVKPNGKKHVRITKDNITSVIDDNLNTLYKFDLVPCGHCIGCRLDHAKQWSIRCCLEASFYDHNYFVTLTYDDEHNPKHLVKEDLQKFIKKLRTYLERSGKASPRFFANGEYGSSTLRPHYHAIFFNLELDDLKYFKTTNTGTLYNSDFLTKIWNKGHVVVAEVNYHTCNYVARYIVKGYKGADLEKYGFTNEFILMSRRPGIGFGYFDKNNSNLYDQDKIYFNFGDFNGSRNPKYFDYLMEKLDPVLLAKVKDQRKFVADMKSSLEMLNTTLDDESYRLNQENFKKQQLNWMRYREC